MARKTPPKSVNCPILTPLHFILPSPKVGSARRDLRGGWPKGTFLPRQLVDIHLQNQTNTFPRAPRD
jgi:hypothetical protein